jgi:RNA polymerase sigma-70 factor (ECF subfamily)
MNDALLPAIAAGDPHALGRCIRRHGPLVRALARRLAACDADDAVQEIFVEVWRSAHRYDGRASERTFVAAIARRRLIDRWRRSRRIPTLVPFEEVALASAGHHQLEATAELGLAAGALAALRPERRQALMMSACAGMSHQEIADALDMPLGTAKAHVRRAAQQLRRSLTSRNEAALPLAS